MYRQLLCERCQTPIGPPPSNERESFMRKINWRYLLRTGKLLFFPIYLILFPIFSLSFMIVGWIWKKDKNWFDGPRPNTIYTDDIPIRLRKEKYRYWNIWDND